MTGPTGDPGDAGQRAAAENLTPEGDPDPADRAGDPQPRIVVAPGPQGAAGPWQYRCEGCGEQAPAEGRDDARDLAGRHRAEAHGGNGSIDVTHIGAV
jgi:hypothetical protein